MSSRPRPLFNPRADARRRARSRARARSRVRLYVAIGAVSALTAAVGAVSAFAAGSNSISSSATATTETFTYTGDVQSFTVPENVCRITVDALGGAGGSITGPAQIMVLGINGQYTTEFPIAGGLGGQAAGVLDVTPGETLDVVVGGVGGDATNAVGSAAGTGGFPNGGNGVRGYSASSSGGAGGGGSSAIVRDGERVIVAGGGGGTGATATNYLPGAGRGGNGGGNGANGEDANSTGNKASGLAPDLGVTTGGASGGDGGAGGLGRPDGWASFEMKIWLVAGSDPGAVGGSDADGGFGGDGGFGPGQREGANVTYGGVAYGGGGGGGGYHGGGGGGGGNSSGLTGDPNVTDSRGHYIPIPKPAGGGGGGGGSGFGPDTVHQVEGVNPGNGSVAITYDVSEGSCDRATEHEHDNVDTPAGTSDTGTSDTVTYTASFDDGLCAAFAEITAATKLTPEQMIRNGVNGFRQFAETSPFPSYTAMSGVDAAAGYVAADACQFDVTWDASEAAAIESAAAWFGATPGQLHEAGGWIAVYLISLAMAR